MNRKWTVGSLVPGKETPFCSENIPIPVAQTAIKEASKQAVVKIKQGNLACSIPVSQGKTLLDAALAQGCGIQYKCRKGTCGQCAVDLVSGAPYLSARNEAEQKKLGSSPRRLACQSIMKD